MKWWLIIVYAVGFCCSLVAWLAVAYRADARTGGLSLRRNPLGARLAAAGLSLLWPVVVMFALFDTVARGLAGQTGGGGRRGLSWWERRKVERDRERLAAMRAEQQARRGPPVPTPPAPGTADAERDQPATVPQIPTPPPPDLSRDAAIERAERVQAELGDVQPAAAEPEQPT